MAGTFSQSLPTIDPPSRPHAWFVCARAPRPQRRLGPPIRVDPVLLLHTGLPPQGEGGGEGAVRVQAKQSTPQQASAVATAAASVGEKSRFPVGQYGEWI